MVCNCAFTEFFNKMRGSCSEEAAPAPQHWSLVSYTGRKKDLSQVYNFYTAVSEILIIRRNWINMQNASETDGIDWLSKTVAKSG